MGGSASSMNAGDEVVIGPQEMRVVKEMQKEHGDWTDAMRECLIGPCVIIQDNGTDAVVKAPSGSVFRLNSKLLVKYGSSGAAASPEPTQPVEDEFSVLTADESRLKTALSGSRESSDRLDEMSGLLAQRAKISNCTITHNAKTYTLDRKCIVDPSSSNAKPICVGDMVTLTSDTEEMKRLQDQHGGWSDLMQLLLVGQQVQVVSVLEDGDLYVSRCGTDWLVNPGCVVDPLTKVGTGAKNPQSEQEPLKPKGLVCVSSGSRATKQLQGDCDGGIEPMKLTTGRTNTLDDSVATGAVWVNAGDTNVCDSVIQASALELAVLGGDYELCCELVERGADVNALNDESMTPIMYAAQNGNQDILGRLVRHPDANLEITDGDGDTALHLAVQKSRTDSVETLLRAGADMRAVNQKQFSAFHLAALRGHKRILELFLQQQGTSVVDLQKDDKYAAIHLVALNNHPDCLRLLIQHQADVNIRTDKLQTALHLAVSKKNMECVQILVASKAELNLRDESGDTPLHDAIRVHQIDKLKGISPLIGLGEMMQLMGVLHSGSDKPEDIALYLVQNGASLHIVNHSGKSPLAECQDNDLKAKLELVQTMQNWSHNDQVPDTNTRDREIEELKRKIEKLEEEKKCTICYDKTISVTFGCGHITCTDCAINLFECPMCRTKIDKKIKTFL